MTSAGGGLALAPEHGGVVREAQRQGMVATVSDKTVWRWLHHDAIRPWQHRTWIFPRDPDCALAALDVHRATLFGRCEGTTGIAPFDRLVTQVMTQSPYREARRVFWIVDNGSSHRGAACVHRLQTAFPNPIPGWHR